MWFRMQKTIANRVTAWLRHKLPRPGLPLTDFAQLRRELIPGDVLLVEGRTRVARTISQVTLSPWTHAALFIGRAQALAPPIAEVVSRRLPANINNDELVLEAELGLGTVVRSLAHYRDEHLRICRPAELSEADVQQVIAHGLRHLGKPYNVRQIFDLFRFFLPYAVLPRRWRSTLFEHNAGEPTHVVCSSMLAAAFASVRYPIVPTLRRAKDGTIKAWPRNSKLITPKDFDYSPYFRIIKYPYYGFDNLQSYRDLDWQSGDPHDS